MSAKWFTKYKSLKSISPKRLILSQSYKPLLLVGRKTRFRCALRLVKIIEPLTGRFSLFTAPKFVLGEHREYLTASLLNSLTFHNIEFDPIINVNGAELIDSDGAIFISGHFYLNFVFLRWLYDIGREPAIYILTGTDEWRILGTKVPFDVLNNRKMKLNYTRRIVSKGKIVAVAIDDTLPHPDWKKLNIAHRDIYVSDALIRLAEQTKLKVFFFDTYFDKNYNIAADIKKASSSETSVVLDEFAEFMSAALSRRK